MADIPIEIEFIAGAVQPQPDVDRLHELASSNLDWDTLVREANDRHKVAPLLYRNLREIGVVESIPDHTGAELKQLATQTATRNLTLVNVLFTVLDRFEEHGIPALPYKGPTLSEAVYGDFSLRQSRDLDILVRPNDLFTAEEVLLDAGFESKQELTENKRRLLLKNSRHLTVKRDGVLVELHPRVSTAPDSPYTVEELLEGNGAVTISGREVPAIPPLESLHVLCVHGTRHRWNQLKWITDVSYLLEGEYFDVSRAMTTARQRGCYRRVLLGCALASSIHDVELPSGVRDEVAQGTNYLYTAVYPGCLIGGKSEDGRNQFGYQLKCRDDAFAMVRYALWQIATPSKADAKAIDLPQKFHTLYYLVRPIRVMGIIGYAALRQVRSRLQ